MSAEALDVLIAKVRTAKACAAHYEPDGFPAMIWADDCADCARAAIADDLRAEGIEIAADEVRPACEQMSTLADVATRLRVRAIAARLRAGERT